MTKKDSNQGACIANRIKLAREQAGLSQGQVAKLIGIHRPSISEIEAGRRKVTAEELTAFAEIFGVSMEWLACADAGTPDEHRDRIELAARELEKIDPDDLDVLINLLRSLKKDDGSEG